VHLATSTEQIVGSKASMESLQCFVHHIRFPRGSSVSAHLAASKALKKLVWELSPDIIHCHFSTAALTAAIALSRNWPPTIATIQGLGFPQVRGIAKIRYGLAEYLIARRLSGIWVLSQSDINAYKSIGINHKVFLQKGFGFGCRLDLFDSNRFSSEERKVNRGKLNIAENDIVFVFVGRQVHFKGFHLVVRAFRMMHSICEHSRLLLVGGMDSIHRTGLSKEDEVFLQKSDSVIQVGWQNDVAQYLTLADVNVFPSEREGMPVNVMESIAIGLPVITSNSRGCVDLVQDGVNGIVLKKCIASEICHAMHVLYTNPGLRRMFSENAKKIRGQFNRNSWIEEQINIYQGIIR
jgi:glycosyltransferase involved in cell wall biosynthesis